MIYAEPIYNISVELYNILDATHIEFFSFLSLFYTSIFAYKIENRDNFRYNGAALERTSNAGGREEKQTMDRKM